MARENYSDLLAFIAVARTRSFTRAAAQLGISASAVSHTVRALETRMGVRLLTRTTRSVSPTDAGERLLQSVGPRFEEIEAEIAAITDLRDKPSGVIRITTAEHAANTILWPKLSKLLRKYPDIQVEISVDYSLADIAAQRFDAGVRLGYQVAKDMVAVRISPNHRIAVVGSAGYFAKHPIPKVPQDLAEHSCINLRLPTHGSLLPWDFDKDGEELKVRVTGQWTFNSSSPIVRAALEGHGLAFVPEDMVLSHLRSGELLRVLDDWCAPYAGYHLYYPSRRQPSAAFTLVVDALRYRETD